MSSSDEDERRFPMDSRRQKKKVKASSKPVPNVKKDAKGYGAVVLKKFRPSLTNNIPESDFSEESVSAHCHENIIRRPNENAAARKTLITASIICLIFMIVELIGSLSENVFRLCLFRLSYYVGTRPVGFLYAKESRFLYFVVAMVFVNQSASQDSRQGGYIAGSLAIMTDAAHLLSDFASFMISLISLYLSSRPATRRMSFGWHRAEVVGAVISVLMIWVLTGVLVYVAIERLVYKKYDVHGDIMAITAALGVLVNVVMGIVLHRGGHGHSHGASSSRKHHHNHNHNHCDSAEYSNGTILGTHGSMTKLSVITPLQQKLDNGFSPTGSKMSVLFVADSEEKDSQGKSAVAPYQSVHPAAPAEATLVDLVSSDDEETETKNRCCPDWLWPCKKSEYEKLSGGKKKQQNINVRAAMVHVIGDFVQSVGIFIAALIIYFRPDLAIVDPICTFIFSVLVLCTTLSVIRDALNVLMEARPRGVSFREVNASLLSLEGVRNVHDLRIWSLTMDKIALSTHLAVDEDCNAQLVLRRATKLLRERFNVYECTVQIEHYSNAMDECKNCEAPKR